MTLGIYREIATGSYEAYSADSTYINPIATVHHGRDGDTFELQLFVRSNDAHTYTNIQVDAQSLTSIDDIGSGTSPGATGWGVKLLKDHALAAPSEDDWAAVDYGAAITISDIANNSTYRSFWYRIESPSNISVQTKTNIGLYLLYTDTP